MHRIATTHAYVIFGTFLKKISRVSVWNSRHNTITILPPPDVYILKNIITLYRRIEQVTRKPCTNDSTCSDIMPVLNSLTKSLKKKTSLMDIDMDLKSKFLIEIYNKNFFSRGISNNPLV